MNKFSGWISRLASGFRSFMSGRYGHDRLNMMLLTLGMILSLLTIFFKQPMADLLLTFASYGLLIWSLVRCFSRNTYRRYQENRKFLLMIDRMKDRNNRYFTCPRCHQMVRVPKGKGRISITCPRCKEKFVKKT